MTKASQSISGEIVLDKLVRMLLHVVLEQGGAERACLILSREGGLSIEAEADLQQKGTVSSLLGAEAALPRYPATLAVRDHGIGIDPAKVGRIFGRFERAVSERHGLGLGLYISRRIGEDHGGAIRCESQPGAGSTFTVELPVAPPS